MVGTITMVMGGYWTRPDRLSVSSRLAKLTKSQRFRTLWRWHLCETLLRWPPENFKHMSFAISGSTSELASLTHDGLLC